MPAKAKPLPIVRNERKLKDQPVWTAGTRNFLLLLPPVAMLVVLFLVPLLTMVMTSFGSAQGRFAPYLDIMTNPALYWPIVYTLWTAATVTVATLVLSYPVAFLVSTLRGRLLNIALALVVVPFWTSTVIRTYAWIVLVQRRGILNQMLLGLGMIDRPLRLIGSDGIVEVAMVHLMLPFMILPLLNALRGIDKVYLQAASVLGANPYQQFVRVYLPLSMPGVSAGCALVFISTLGFYVTPALLGGSSLMISVLIEQQASRLLNWPMASALGTLLLLITCGLFLIYERTVNQARITGGRASA